MSSPILIPAYTKQEREGILPLKDQMRYRILHSSSLHENFDNNKFRSHSFPPSKFRIDNYKGNIRGNREFNRENNKISNKELNKEYKNFRINKKIRKCAYIIGIITSERFSEFGGTQLEEDPNIYVAKRTYDEIDNNATCAVIGIKKHYIQYLFEDNSILYQTLKKSQLLQNIYGIESLRAYRLEPLKQLLNFLFFIPDDELVIFNIEPKGLNDKVRIYPTANVCIPGGGMESEDGNCYEMCGRREFQEETKIIIPDSIKYIVRHQYNLPDRHAVYFMIKMF